MKTKRVEFLLVFVFLAVVFCGNAFAAKGWTGLVVFNSNKTLSAGGHIRQNGKQSDMEAYLGGPDKCLMTRTDAIRDNVRYEYKVYNEKGEILNNNGKGKCDWLYREVSDSFSNRKADKTTLKLYADKSHYAMIYSYK